MKINDATIKLIKSFEGCYLKAYKDCVGVWTIGYGITNSDKAITGKTIKKGLTISKATAEKWLIRSLEKKYAPKVDKYQKIYKFNENQYGALVSFAYNVGSIDGLTAHGTRSISQIKKKILEYNKGGGRVLAGLVRRREAELKLFNTPVTKKTEPATPKKYTNPLPMLPARGHYQVGDGYKTITNWKTQIKRVQDALNWALEKEISAKKIVKLTKDGEYGNKTADAVKAFQKKYKFADINGKWGNLCNKQMEKIVK